MIKRHHLIVEGRVQGVGFRYFTQKLAQQFGLVGWVRNLPDGTVEVEAEGEDQLFEPFLHALKTKNRFAKVNHIQRRLKEETTSERSFDIKH